MEVTIENDGNTMTYFLTGVIDIPGAKMLRGEMKKIIYFKPKKVILDFAEVSFIGSSGIGNILLYHRQLNEWGGSIELRNVNHEIRALLCSIRLDKLLDF
jgi:anti-anti-sigma factor